MVRSLRVQSQQLPTESQVLKDEVLAGTASADHPSRNMDVAHAVIHDIASWRTAAWLLRVDVFPQNLGKL